MRCCSSALSFINIFIEWDKLLTFGDIMNGPGVLQDGGACKRHDWQPSKGFMHDLRCVYSAGDI